MSRAHGKSRHEPWAPGNLWRPIFSLREDAVFNPCFPHVRILQTPVASDCPFLSCVPTVAQPGPTFPHCFSVLWQRPFRIWWPFLFWPRADRCPLYPPGLELENIHGINSKFETILKQTNTPENKTEQNKIWKNQPTTTTLKWEYPGI